MLTQHLRAWRSGAGRELSLQYEPGNRGDLASLAPLHYRAGPPATIDRVLRVVDTEHGVLAGVLVTSRPTLNGAWRTRAWGDAFATGDRSRDARAINERLRTISRVIVDPRFRGLGVGSRLVRAYLARPATPCTEAVTALGGVCPFFERAGMRRIVVPTPARHGRLLRALGVSDEADAAVLLMTPRAHRALETPLRRWARASASTRRLAEGDPAAIAAAAAGALLAPPAAYVHGTPTDAAPSLAASTDHPPDGWLTR